MTELTCAAARELMLDAEPTLLHGDGNTPLERHLRACASCAPAARAILDNDTALVYALRTLVDQAASRRRPAHARAARHARPRWLALAAPAAAAAALLVVWQVQRTQPAAQFEPILVPAERVPDVPIVNVPRTGTVAVMRTSNPNITVVWNF